MAFVRDKDVLLFLSKVRRMERTLQREDSTEGGAVRKKEGPEGEQ